MTTPFDRERADVERMLSDRTRQPPPPGLRTRVLAAVDDVLKKVPATKYGEPGEEESSDRPDLVAGTFFCLLMTALSFVFVVTMSGALDRQRGGPPAARPPLSFAQRAEAAGITLDLGTHAADRLASARPYDAGSPHRGDILHVLDARTLLKGDL